MCIRDRVYPYYFDSLGRTNGLDPSTITPSGLTWYDLACRYSKIQVMYHAAGVSRMLHWLAPSCCFTPASPGYNSAVVGWYNDIGTVDQPDNGKGPQPMVDIEMLVDFWLHGSTFVTTAVETNGVNIFEFHNGNSTNAFVWAPDGTSVTTNLGAALTDIYSNAYNGPVTCLLYTSRCV